MNCKRLLALASLFGITAAPATAQMPGNPLLNLAKINSDARSKRVSSFDRSGGNNDRLETIKDGESRVLFNVFGAGIINHIWIITIHES